MNPLLIDTHTHVNFNAYKDDGDETIKRALDQSVWLFNVGSQLATSRRAVEYAERYKEGVYAIVGLHPVHLTPQKVDEQEVVGMAYETQAEEFDYDAYKDLAVHPKVIGIGECGLEYFHLPDGNAEAIKSKQREAFLQQIELAIETQKVLMVHSRDAYADIYGILKDRAKKLPGIVIHSFIGNWEEAKNFLDIGCHLGFNGIITYKPKKEKTPGSSDPGLMEAVKNAPLNRIVLETDAPYLTPPPHRGERNEPAYVRFVAEKLEELKGIAPEEVAAQTTKNTRQLFGI